MISIESHSQWNATLAALPAAHPLQSWEWGQFKSRWGWSAKRLLWLKGDTPAASAQVLARPIPRTPWKFLYVAKGPALDYADMSLLAQVLADLQAYARRVNALFIKIDPDVPLQIGEPGQNPPLLTGQIVLNLLTSRGWRLSPEQIQFKNTVLIDLTGDSDDLLARMKSKWRYNIRYAERKGVVIRPATQADIPSFYHMYAQTAARDGFLIRRQAYYSDVWTTFMQANLADMLLAEVNGQAVAGLILFRYANKVWYMYGASTEEHRNLMPNHLLQYAAMGRAKERGCTTYDMWGAPAVFDESDSMWGVYRFKQGFGGETVLGLGAYDYPLKPALYRLFTQLMPQARALLRRLR